MSEAPNTESPGHYPTTEWTGVIEKIQKGDSAALAALDVFCEQYREVVYRFFRRRFDHDVADDYTQEFFQKKVHRPWDDKEGLLFNVKREKAIKFRTSLATAMHYFLKDKWRQKNRDPLANPVGDEVERATENDMEKVQQDCDRELALRVIQRALKSARPSDVQLRYLNQEISDSEAAAALEMKDGTFRVSIHRLTKELQQALRREIRNLVASDAEVEDEIRHFLEILRHPRNAGQ